MKEHTADTLLYILSFDTESTAFKLFNSSPLKLKSFCIHYLY